MAGFYNLQFEGIIVSSRGSKDCASLAVEATVARFNVSREKDLLGKRLDFSGTIAIHNTPGAKRHHIAGLR
jgi:hypothetical protein